MAQSSPETNMAILGNGGELVRLIISELMSNEQAKQFMGTPCSRENIYRVFTLAVHKRLEPKLRELPTGQFNASVLEGRHQTGRANPNVTVQTAKVE